MNLGGVAIPTHAAFSPLSWCFAHLFLTCPLGPTTSSAQKPCKLGTEPAVCYEQRQGHGPGLWDSRDGVHPLCVLLHCRAEERGQETGQGSGPRRSRGTSLSASVPLVKGGRALHQPFPQCSGLSRAVVLWKQPHPGVIWGC